MSEISHDSRQMDLFDWRVKLPVNGRLQLFFEESLPKHQRVERAVLRVAAAYPNRLVPIKAIRQHLALEGAIKATHADYCLLHRILSHSGAFERKARGVYLFREGYRPRPPLSRELAAELHRRRGQELPA